MAAPSAAERRPRVLFVATVPDFKGGAETVLQAMLANPLIDPVLAVPEEGVLADAARDMGVPVYAYHPGAMLRVHRPLRPGPVLRAIVDAIRCALRLQRIALAQNCAVIHGNGLKPNMLCSLIGLLRRAQPWSRNKRPRTLIHLHDIAYTRRERLIWLAMSHCVDKVVAVSRPCYPYATLPPHAVVILNGIKPICPELPPWHPTIPLRLGFVGRFHPNKGMDHLLDWFAAVHSGGLAATLTIRGRPDPDMPEYWDRIAARIRDEGLEPCVQYEGWVSGANTFAGLDVLLMTSKIPDPGPLVVAEAMSAGVIAAGFPKGGFPYLVEDGRTGLVIEDGDMLVQRLRALLGTPGEFERIRNAGHEFIRTKLSMEAFYSAFRSVYDSLLPSSTTSPASAQLVG